MVNGWSGEEEDVKFEILGSNYPERKAGVPRIGFFHLDHFA